MAVVTDSQRASSAIFPSIFFGELLAGGSACLSPKSIILCIACIVILFELQLQHLSCTLSSCSRGGARYLRYRISYVPATSVRLVAHLVLVFALLHHVRTLSATKSDVTFCRELWMGDASALHQFHSVDTPAVPSTLDPLIPRAAWAGDVQG